MFPEFDTIQLTSYVASSSHVKAPDEKSCPIDNSTPKIDYIEFWTLTILVAPRNICFVYREIIETAVSFEFWVAECAAGWIKSNIVSLPCEYMHREYNFDFTVKLLIQYAHFMSKMEEMLLT